MNRYIDLVDVLSNIMANHNVRCAEISNNLDTFIETIDKDSGDTDFINYVENVIVQAISASKLKAFEEMYKLYLTIDYKSLEEHIND